MTVICALYDEHADIVYLGCNDRATIGDTPAPASESKWHKFGDWAIGLSGNESVHGHFLQLSVDKFPKTTTSVLDVFEFLVARYKKYDLGQVRSDDATRSYGASGLIAHKNGNIWDFDSHIALSQVPKGQLWARGSGVDYALGADYVVQSLSPNLSAHDRMMQVLNAAISLDIDCPGEAMVERFSPS